jgi:protein dithiol oxidoreductase (disulfide-forming)
MVISKFIKSLFVVLTMGTLAMLATSVQSQSANPNIVPLNPPQPVENDGKIEVLEFFAYGCPHCAALEPKLEAWAKKLPPDVKLKRVPGAAALRGIDNAALFYTLEAMGMQDKLQQKIFDAANVQNVILGNPATLNSWLEKQGVDIKKFAEIQKSFSIQNRITRSRAMSVDYKINSVPTVVVNGRFAAQVPAGETGPDQFFVNLDKLIADARPGKKVAANASHTPNKAHATVAHVKK